MLIVHLFVSYAHVNLCLFFSSSCCRGLAGASACSSSWTFLFTFIIFSLSDLITPTPSLQYLVKDSLFTNRMFNTFYSRLLIVRRWNGQTDTCKLTKLSIYLFTNQSINLIDQSVNQYIDKSTDQLIGQSFNQSINQSISIITNQ